MGFPQNSRQQFAPSGGRTNGLSVASLILGLAGFITCGFTSILAIVFGHVALNQIKRDGSDGRGMALSGTILGWFLTGAWILFWVLSITGTISTAIYSAANPTPAAPARTRLDLSPQPGQSATSQAPTGQPQDGRQAIVLEVVGKDGATSIGNLTYMVKLDLKQESGVPLPYTRELSADDPYPLSLIAQNAGAEGSIECRIKVGGRVVREGAGSGPYGVCNVRVDTP